MTTKKCTGCDLTKALDQFHTEINGAHGRRSKCKDCRAKEKKRWRWDTLTARFANYKTSCTRLGARKEGMLFDITIEQFDTLTSQICHYCGQFSHGHSYCGVDRVDDNLGYTLNNCVPCCTTCNFMKHKLDVDYFLAHVAKIYAWSIKPKS